MPSAVPVLITRPQPQADRLAAELTGVLKGAVAPVLSPILATEFPDVHLPEGRFRGVILTSEAGAVAAGRLRDRLPDRALCVGQRTAEVAEQAGFRAECLGETGQDLVRSIVDRGEDGPLIYLRGRDVSAALDVQLTEAGIPAVSETVYAQVACPLTGAAQALLAESGPVILPLYSARSARLVFDAMTEVVKADLRVCVISAGILPAVPEKWRGQCVVAAAPDGISMREAIVRVISSLLP